MNSLAKSPGSDPDRTNKAAGGERMLPIAPTSQKPASTDSLLKQRLKKMHIKTALCSKLTYEHMLTCADVCWRVLTCADVC
jgi:DNA polymerase III psi subunit